MLKNVKYAFMSSEQKRIQNRLEMRRSVRDLERWDRSLEKKKSEMIKLGQEANRQGIKEQYALAFNGLKMIMNQQLRARRMQLQLKLLDSLRDLSQMSSGFMGMMGKVSKEINKVTSGTNFLKNQAAFESGMISIEQMMGQMDSFMEDMDMNMEDQAGPKTVSDEEIARLFDIPEVKTAEAAPAADPRISDLSKQLKDMLGEGKTGE